MTSPATGRAVRRRPLRKRLTSRLTNAAAALVALTVLGGVYAALAPSGHAATTDTTGNQQAIANGRDLFLRGCSTCHGLNAQGGSEAPSLVGVGGAAVDFQVGTGRMPLAVFGGQAVAKKPRYNQQQIDDLAAYIQSLGGGPTVPANAYVNQFHNADETHGGELFRTNCAQCHNTQGEGGALSGGQYAPALVKTDPKHIIEAMLTGPEQMPVFPDSQLTPSEKLDIVKYVTAVSQKGQNAGGNGLGRIGPVSEGLVAFIVGIGLCVVLTLWIGARA